MNPVSIAARLLTGPVADLEAINEKLVQRGFPRYFLGESGFNIQYRIANKPRYVFSWWPPGARLAEFYLFYMPNIPAGREPTTEDEIVIRLD
jgi:hypothetical protein